MFYCYLLILNVSCSAHSTDQVNNTHFDRDTAKITFTNLSASIHDEIQVIHAGTHVLMVETSIVDL